MNARVRKIEVAAETADLLEARAAARGLSVADLIADLLGNPDSLPEDLRTLHDAGQGPWAADVLAEDARRLRAFAESGMGVSGTDVDAWLRSWGKRDVPAPRPRKL